MAKSLYAVWEFFPIFSSCGYLALYWRTDHYDCACLFLENRSIGRFREVFISRLVTLLPRANQQEEYTVDCISTCTKLLLGIGVLKKAQEKIYIYIFFLHRFYCFPWIVLSMIPVDFWTLWSFFFFFFLMFLGTVTF